MAATKSQAKRSPNGRTAVGDTVKDVGGTAAAAARRARGPMVAAGAAAAGLAGGLAIGSRLGARHRQGGALRAAELLRDSAKHIGSATSRASRTTDDIRAIREQLEKVNSRSPLEVALDGLTHRRGVHRHGD